MKDHMFVGLGLKGGGREIRLKVKLTNTIQILNASNIFIISALPHPDGGITKRKFFFANEIPEVMNLRAFSPSRLKNPKSSFRTRFMIEENAKEVDLKFWHFYKGSLIPEGKVITCKIVKYLVNSNIYMSPDFIMEVPCIISEDTANNYILSATQIKGLEIGTTYEFIALFIDSTVNLQNANPPSRYHGFYQVMEFISNTVLYTELKVKKLDNSIVTYQGQINNAKTYSDLVVSGYTLTSKVSDERKSFSISFKTLELIPAYPNSMIEIHLSSRKPGNSTIWNYEGNLFNPPVANGHEASCYIAKNLQNNSGTSVNIFGREKARCLYYWGISNTQPAIIRFVDYGSFIGTDEIVLIVENLIGPNDNAAQFTLKVVKDIFLSSEKTFVLYNQFLYGKQKNQSNEILENSLSFVINNPLHDEYGATGVIMEYTLNQDYGEFTEGDKFELKLSKFLSSVTSNVENVVISFSGHQLAIIYRNPVSNTILAVVPPSITISALAGTKILLSNIENPLKKASNSSEMEFSFRIYRDYDMVVNAPSAQNNEISTSSSSMDLSITNLTAHDNGIYKVSMTLGSPVSSDTFNIIRIGASESELKFMECLKITGGFVSSLNEKTCFASEKNLSSYLNIYGIYGPGIQIEALIKLKSSPSVDFTINLFDSENNLLFVQSKSHIFGFEALTSASSLEVKENTNHNIQRTKVTEIRNGEFGEVVFGLTSKEELNASSVLSLEPFISNNDVFSLGSLSYLKCQIQIFNANKDYYGSPYDVFECKFDGNSKKEISISGFYPIITLGSKIKVRINRVDDSGIAIPMQRSQFFISYGNSYKDIIEFIPFGKLFTSVKANMISTTSSNQNFIEFSLKVPTPISQYQTGGVETKIEIEFSSFSGSTDLGANSFGIRNGEPYLAKSSTSCQEEEKNIILFGNEVQRPKILHYLLSDHSNTANPIKFTLPIQNPSGNSQFSFSVKISQLQQNSLLENVLFSKNYLSSKATQDNTIDENPISNFNAGNPSISSSSQVQFTFNNPETIDRASFSGFSLKFNAPSETLNLASICSFEAKKSVSELYSFEVYSAGNAKLLLERSNLNIGTGSTPVIQNGASQFDFLSIPGNISVQLHSFSNGKLTSKKDSNSQTVNPISDNFDAAATIFQKDVGFNNLNNQGIYKLSFKTFYLIPQFTKILVQFPSEIVPFKSNVFNSEICAGVEGLSAHNDGIVACSKVSNSDFVINGYQDITAGSLVSVYFYLKIDQSGLSIRPTINVLYSVNGKSFSTLSPQNGVDTGILNSPISQLYSMLKIKYITPEAKSDFSFLVDTRNQPASFSPSTDSYNVIIELPNEFTVDNGSIINSFYKETGANTLLQTLNTEYSTVPTGIKFNITLLAGQFLNKDTKYEFIIAPRLNGEKSFNFPGAGKYQVSISTFYKGALKEIGEYTLDLQHEEPSSGLLNYVPFLNHALAETYSLVSITSPIDIEPNDQIWIEFPMKNNFGVPLYQEDLGIGTSDSFSKIYCEEAFGAKNISDDSLFCELARGDSANNFPASIRVLVKKQILKDSTFSFIFGKVKNPGIADGLVAVKIILKRKKVGENTLDNLISKDIVFLTGSLWNSNYVPSNEGIALNVSNVSLAAKHEYTLKFNNALSAGSYLIFEYPDKITELPAICTFESHACIVVRGFRNIIVKLNSDILASVSGKYQLELQNGLFKPTVNSSLFQIKLQAISGKQVIEAYSFNSPEYSYTNDISIDAKGLQNLNGDFLKGYNFIHVRIEGALDNYVKGGWIKVSGDFTGFDQTLCNATIENELQDRNLVYPAKLECKFLSSNLLEISGSAENTVKGFTLNPSQIINLYFGIYIDETLPTGKFSISAGSIVVLGVESYRKYGSKEFTISDLPISSDSRIQLSKKAYISSNQLSLGFALKPNISSAIVEIEINLPSEFKTLFSSTVNFAQCSLQTSTENILVSSCSADSSQNNGRTIKVTVSGYTNSQGYLEINDLLNIYELPSSPSSTYTAEIKYTAFDAATELKKIKFNPIIGRSLENLRVASGRDISTLTKLDVEFDVGSNKVEKGYTTENDLSYSIIYLAFSKLDGFLNDLGTGLDDGQRLGVAMVSGITALKSFNCVLKHGSSNTDPEVHCYGQNEIPANTKGVKFMIGNIKASSSTNPPSIRVGVRKYTMGKILPAVSHEFSISSLLGASASTYPSAQSRTITVNGFTETGTSNDLIFSVTNANFLKKGDYISVQLPKDIMWMESPLISISTVPSTTVYVLKESRTLYFLIEQKFNEKNFDFQVKGVPGVPYKVSGSHSISLQTVISGKIVENFVYSLPLNTNERNISNFTASISDNTPGMVETFIDFTIVPGHYVNLNGAIKVEFYDYTYKNFSKIGVECTLYDLGPIVSCDVKYRGIVINLNGYQLNATSVVKARISHLVNPNSAPTNNQNIKAEIFYDSNLTKLSSQKVISYPDIVLQDKHKCDFTIASNITTEKSFSNYLIQISCNKILMDNSKIVFTLSESFAQLNLDSSLECSGVNVQLLNGNCKTTIRKSPSNNDVLDIEFQLGANSPLLFDLKLSLIRNGKVGTHKISNSLFYKENAYGDEAVFNLAFEEASGDQFVNSTNPVVSNVHYEFNTPSADSIYKFGVEIPITVANLDELRIYFPSDYSSDLGDNSLDCGYMKATNDLFGEISNSQYLPLLASSQKINCSRTGTRQITLTGVSGAFSLSGKTIFFISKIQNPQNSVSSALFKGQIMKSANSAWISFQNSFSANFTFTPYALVLTNISTTNKYNYRYADVELEYKTSGSYSGDSNYYIEMNKDIYGHNHNSNNVTCSSSLKSDTICDNFGVDIQSNNTIDVGSGEKIVLGIKSIKNPKDAYVCPSTGVFSFKTQFANSANSLQYKTFNHLNARNSCIDYENKPFEITASGPTEIEAGKSYRYNVSLEVGSKNLTVNTSSNISLSELEKSVSFNNENELQKSFEIILPNTTNAQFASLDFQVIDPSGYYNTVVPSKTLNISEAPPVENNDTNTTNGSTGGDGTNSTDNTTGNSTGSDNTTTGNSTDENSTNNSNTTNSTDGNGTSGSVALKTVMVYYQGPEEMYKNTGPNFIRFYVNETLKEVLRIKFTQNCYNELLLSQGFIELSQTSLSKNLEVNLNPAMMNKNCTIFLETETPYTSPLSQTHLYVLQRERVYIEVKTEITTGAKPVVEWVKIVEVKKNAAIFKLQVDINCFISYTIARRSSVTPLKEQLAKREYPAADKYGTAGTYQFGNKFQSDIYEENLIAGENYVLYVVANTSADTSNIFATNFSTKTLSEGIVFKMYFSDQVIDTDKLRKTISNILRVPLDRVKDIFAETTIIDEPNTPPNVQKTVRFVISPDVRKDDITEQTVKRLDSADAKKQFSYDFPNSYISSELMDFFKYKLPMPTFVKKPSVISFSYYRVSFNVSLSKSGQVFGLRIPRAKRDQPFYNKLPTGKQIIQGLNQDNVPVPTKYYISRVRLDENQEGTLEFKDLRASTVYDIYFVIANDKVYDPPDFSTDNAYVVQFGTVRNQNTLG